MRHCSVRLLGQQDAAIVARASHLFDHPIVPDQMHRFLSSDRDFLWFAFDGDTAIGFATATTILHPDSRPVLFLNEIAVADAAQRHGVGRSLMQMVFKLAELRGWQSTWVLADQDDERAVSFYRSLRPQIELPSIMFEWEDE